MRWENSARSLSWASIGRAGLITRTLPAVLMLCAVWLSTGVASAATSTPNTALIDGESVTTVDGIAKEETPISLEQFAAEHAGFNVTVVTGAEWEAMTAAQFAKYQVLIVGDPDCGSTAPSAINSAATWTSVVMETSKER